MYFKNKIEILSNIYEIYFRSSLSLFLFFLLFHLYLSFNLTLKIKRDKKEEEGWRASPSEKFINIFFYKKYINNKNKICLIPSFFTLFHSIILYFLYVIPSIQIYNKKG